MSKRRADDMSMDVEEPIGKRARKPTEKGAEFAVEVAKKKAKAEERKAKLKAKLQAKPRDFPGLNDMLAELDAIDTSNPEVDSQLDALTARFGAMGGRRRRTHKKKRHGARRTRKH